MGLIPNEIIGAVLDRSDIASVIGRYVQLKKAGRNFKALCPFHHEKSPSFVVNPDKQIFHCFGCGVGGNAIGFIMRQERLEFPQAVRFLADQCGITIPEDGDDNASPDKKIRDAIYQVNELAVGFYHDRLLTGRDPAATAAREYLKGRGVSLETVRQFQLGFAPDEWESLITFLKGKGIPLNIMEHAGLIIAREKGSGHYDRFRNRVIFPIFDIQSRAVAFGARAMADEAGAKYINSPETPVYTKGRHLFGFNLTKAAVGKVDAVIVVEGYMDMIMPFIHGVEHIAASLGTALTVEQIRLIRRYTTNVVMLFDTDDAGQNAIIRSLDLLVEEGMNVRVATLDPGQDPDSFIRKNNAQLFRRRLDCAESLFHYKLGWLSAQFDKNTIEGRSKICRQMQSTINRHKDEVVKYELTKSLGAVFDIPIDILLKQAHTPGPQISSPKPPPALPVRAPVTTGSKSEEMLLTLFATDPQWIAKGKEALTLEDFSDGLVRHIIRILWHVNDEQHWSSSALLNKVEDPSAQAYLSRLLSHEEGFLAEPQQVFDDCVRRIKNERLKKHRQQLMENIRDAEAKGDQEAVVQLTDQINRLLK